jgi:hypothetical protein
VFTLLRFQYDDVTGIVIDRLSSMPCAPALLSRGKCTPNWGMHPHKGRERGHVHEVCLIHCQTQVESARNAVTTFFCTCNVLYAWNK